MRWASICSAQHLLGCEDWPPSSVCQSEEQPLPFGSIQSWYRLSQLIIPLNSSSSPAEPFREGFLFYGATYAQHPSFSHQRQQYIQDSFSSIGQGLVPARAISNGAQGENVKEAVSNMAAQSLYGSHKLDLDKREIRLVKFNTASAHPGPVSPWEIDIQVFQLAQAPPFQAVSYVWGDPNITEPVLAGGCSLLVTKNLLAALSRIHKHCGVESDWPEPPAFLWIDAICINQQDTVEKQHQIRLMRDIYTGAAEVIMWVGEWSEDDREVLPLIEQWAKVTRLALYECCMQRRLEKDAIVEAIMRIASETRDGISLVDETENRDGFIKLYVFLLREYWKRAWILQETVLARRGLIVCGGEEGRLIDLWFALSGL